MSGVNLTTAIKVGLAGAAIASGVGAWAAPGMLASLSAGALVTGGVATLLGTTKGGDEGDKWAETGGYLMLAGGIGSYAANHMATAAVAPEIAGPVTPINGSGLINVNTPLDATLQSAPQLSELGNVAVSTPAQATFAAPGSMVGESVNTLGGASANALPQFDGVSVVNNSIANLSTTAPQTIPNASGTGLINWMKANPVPTMVLGQAATGLASGVVTADAEKERLARENARFRATQYA